MVAAARPVPESDAEEELEDDNEVADEELAAEDREPATRGGCVYAAYPAVFDLDVDGLNVGDAPMGV